MPIPSSQSTAAFAEFSTLPPNVGHAVAGALVLVYLLGDDSATVNPILQTALSILPASAVNLRALLAARSKPSAGTPTPIHKIGPSVGLHAIDFIVTPANVEPSALPWPAAAAAYLGTDVPSLLSWADYVASKGYSKAASLMYERAISALNWLPTSTHHRELMTVAMLHPGGETDTDGTILPIDVNHTKVVWTNALSYPTPTNALALASPAQALADNGFTQAAKQLTDLAAQILKTG